VTPRATAADEDTDSLLLEVEPAAARRLLQAALDSFASRGFHATTTRDISTAAGLSPAAVYVHYASKSELLHELSRIGHEAVLVAVEAAVDEGSDPESRTRAFVETFTSWHAEHHTLARVLQYELRSLPPESLGAIIDLRDKVERVLERQLRAGVRSHAFAIDDLHGTAQAILSLGIDVARWYEPGGRRKPQAIGALYAELVLRMLAPA